MRFWAAVLEMALNAETGLIDHCRHQARPLIPHIGRLDLRGWLDDRMYIDSHQSQTQGHDVLALL